TDLLAGQLLREGMRIVADPREADAVLVNTCAFLTASQQESIDTILELVETKKARADQRLLVLGCLAQRHGGRLLEEIPEIDGIVGPGEVHAVAPRIRDWFGANGDGGARDAGATVRLGGMDRVEEDWDIRVVSRHPHSAYVKISEGCDRTCSFCIIPKLRGPHRSRSRESIVREVAMLGRMGVREVNLVAQELTAYGVDRTGRSELAALLGDLEADGAVDWIRLLYTYPSNWSDHLVETIRECSRVVPYVDLPIQHADPGILRAMRRPPPDRTRRLLDRLRERIPEVSLRTTLITGFPGETEEAFRALVELVRAIRFDALGVFAYSTEEGTDAAGLAGEVPEAERERRRGAILEIQREIAAARAGRRVGSSLTVLIDEVEGGGGAIGRHAGQAPEVDGVTRIVAGGGPDVRPGEFRRVVVTGSRDYDLEARLVEMGEPR
ncbi:MAG: 30S ribosomal protein S12 methylthiotransferase RimO, partial [Candidatus Eisenbacteria bacterium]|nr:30S ribosomal protein S12 methylthiotransferase RimO [Candidatus Latescibacterota bacterium]MBD3303172.1 30S ribosomal protein S12 methylthiotransferase RimO [Candidatus Eisenbacteria bacterium]